MSNAESLSQRLIEKLAGYGKCVIAFSAGVDSSVVAAAAARALGGDALAVTAVSASLATGELDEAKEIAEQIGIPHRVIRTGEVSNADYAKNGHDRCYFCKSELYEQLDAIAASFPECVLVNGTNVDDLGDHRPGLTAASEHQVRSPLVECEIDKAMVRQIAKLWDLPVWNKPAMPCLSSRIAYGVEVTPERLRMIDGAESFLRQHGFRELRVRCHENNLARIEVPRLEVARLAEEPLCTQVADELKRLGFQTVTIDLDGFRSGNLNTLIPVEALQIIKKPQPQK